MIKEKTEEIQQIHDEVYELQTQFKGQQKDREDVILKLNKDNDESMKKHILLQNKIDEYRKKNEKVTNDAQ